jgi:DNA-binding transcriptional ArsR family regulator
MVAYYEPVSLDSVFKALADRSRRKLLDRLFTNNGQTLNELCVGLGMTRQAVSKHLLLLERANLVATVWSGREKRHYLNPVPIQEIADRWISKYERSRLRVLADLKAQLEEERKKDE